VYCLYWRSINTCTYLSTPAQAPPHGWSACGCVVLLQLRAALRVAQQRSISASDEMEMAALQG